MRLRAPGLGEAPTIATLSARKIRSSGGTVIPS